MLTIDIKILQLTRCNIHARFYCKAQRKSLEIIHSPLMFEMLRCFATCSMSSGVNRDQTELFVHGGKEVFAQYLLRKKKMILEKMNNEL
jgi:hypothetical protein